MGWRGVVGNSKGSPEEWCQASQRSEGFHKEGVDSSVEVTW